MNYLSASSLIPPPSSLFIPFPANACPQLIQSILDSLVAAVDLVDVVDDALALGAERGEQQRHAGADVGTGDLGAAQTAAADDDRAMRIAQHDARAHRDQLVGEEQARL